MTPIPEEVTSTPVPAITETETAVPPVVTTNPGTESSTPVPTLVTSPTASVTSTAVPTAIPDPRNQQETNHSSDPTVSGLLTAQPDLNEALEKQKKTASPTAAETISPGSVSRTTAATPAPGTIAPRDLSRWPIFSSRFPWRRMRMNPEPGIQVPLAGLLRWPVPEAVSPLQQLLQN